MGDRPAPDAVHRHLHTYWLWRFDGDGRPPLKTGRHRGPAGIVSVRAHVRVRALCICMWFYLYV